MLHFGLNFFFFFINKISKFWIPSSLVYTDGDIYFGTEIDPNIFDELEEPPPVHIIYPRPTHNQCESTVVSSTFVILLSLCVRKLIER